MFDKFFFTKFDNLPSLRSQKILIEILIKLFLNPSQAFFLKIKSWKNPTFLDSKRGGRSSNSPRFSNLKGT
jgi:hypothetical protein